MELRMIDIKKIVTNPLQPRQDFDREKLQELADSIKEGELLQPIVVRLNGGNYEIVAGERRYKAFQILKETRIPAIVRDIKDDTDALEKSLIENLQRDDLTSVERENAIGALWDSNRYKTRKELARKLGTGETIIRETLEARDFRKNTPGVLASTRDIRKTAGLDDNVRKKVIEKTPSYQIEDTVKKLKEFPEPEQQIEILDEFEQQEETNREIFDDIVQKKKEIVNGQRKPEHIIEIESDSDKRTIQDYCDIRDSVYGIYSDNIQHFKNEDCKKEAIKIIQDIIEYLNKQLMDLGINVVVDLDEKKKE